MSTTSSFADRVTLAIDGMSCGHCVQAVTKTLSGVPGVRVHAVAVGSAEIDAAVPNAASAAIAALEEAGYPAKVTSRPAAPNPKQAGGCCGGPKGCCG